MERRLLRHAVRPNVWTSYAHALREPAGPVRWAGTETATAWSGYVAGAVRRRLSAQGRVAADGTDSSAWYVQLEGSAHPNSDPVRVSHHTG